MFYKSTCVTADYNCGNPFEISFNNGGSLGRNCHNVNYNACSIYACIISAHFVDEWYAMMLSGSGSMDRYSYGHEYGFDATRDSGCPLGREDWMYGTPLHAPLENSCPVRGCSGKHEADTGWYSRLWKRLPNTGTLASQEKGNFDQEEINEDCIHLAKPWILNPTEAPEVIGDTGVIDGPVIPKNQYMNFVVIKEDNYEWIYHDVKSVVVCKVNNPTQCSVCTGPVRDGLNLSYEYECPDVPYADLPEHFGRFQVKVNYEVNKSTKKQRNRLEVSLRYRYRQTIPQCQCENGLAESGGIKCNAYGEDVRKNICESCDCDFESYQTVSESYRVKRCE